MGLADRYLTEEYRRVLDIRYAALEFTLSFPKGGRVPRNKGSAIRGGMGDVLLQEICLNGRRCDTCQFPEECVIQRMIYTRMDEETRPEFMMRGDSLGYIIDCHDTTEQIDSGGSIAFTLTLFGRTIVHAGLFIQAVRNLGRAGLGKSRAKFVIAGIRQKYPDGSCQFDLSHMVIRTVNDYVSDRLLQTAGEGSISRIVTESPISLKHNGRILTHFDMEVLLKAIQRRVYMLDSFEGIDGEGFYERNLPVPTVAEENHRTAEVRRYSSTHDEKITFKGIEGSIQLGEIADETLVILLAGELLHAGKQTSFGFGKYKVR